jgi:NADPH-dependent 2,4-dienoyl-CoA reductase/sulfur reductase-like enzyme
VNVKYAAEIKKHVKTAVATVGALADPELMEEIIATGKADVVEIARGLLCDPDIPIKARTGRQGEIRKCMRCLACFSTLMNSGQFYCAINPETGREIEMAFELPPAHKKKVLVIGGGVTGMQAALTSAQRGHEVILCEKSGRLGGALNCEENVPFKKILSDYLKQQAVQLKSQGVDIRLNTAVTPETAEEFGADVVIAAVGAKPVVPNIPGIDRSTVLSANDAFMHPEIVGDRTVIIGAGLVGVELGIYLAKRGRKVTIVEIMDDINDGGNFQHAKSLKVEIHKNNIDLHLSTRVLEITENGIRTEDKDGEKLIEANTVIYAVGQTPLREEGSAFKYCAPEFHQLGDCVAPRNIMTATSSAFAVARNIGRV